MLAANLRHEVKIFLIAWNDGFLSKDQKHKGVQQKEKEPKSPFGIKGLTIQSAMDCIASFPFANAKHTPSEPCIKSSGST